MKSLVSKNQFQSGLLMAFCLAISACGSKSTLSGNNDSNNQTNPNDPIIVDPGTNPYGLPVAPTAQFDLTGTAGANPTRSYSVETENVLRVKVVPLPAPNIAISGYQNWVFPYGCAQVRVRVSYGPGTLGVTQVTQVLRVNGMPAAPNSPCANAPTFQVLDFSGNLSGYSSVTVNFENAVYDNCRQFNPLYYGCAMSQIWQNHRMSFSTQIQDNQTFMDVNNP